MMKIIRKLMSLALALAMGFSTAAAVRAEESLEHVPEEDREFFASSIQEFTPDPFNDCRLAVGETHMPMGSIWCHEGGMARCYSSNPAVVEVNPADGCVTAVSGGTAYVLIVVSDRVFTINRYQVDGEVLLTEETESLGFYEEIEQKQQEIQNQWHQLKENEEQEKNEKIRHNRGVVLIAAAAILAGAMVIGGITAGKHYCGSVIGESQKQIHSPSAAGYCPCCGSPIEAGQRFCTHCGSAVG